MLSKLYPRAISIAQELAVANKVAEPIPNSIPALLIEGLSVEQIANLQDEDGCYDLTPLLENEGVMERVNEIACVVTKSVEGLQDLISTSVNPAIRKVVTLIEEEKEKNVFSFYSKKVNMYRLPKLLQTPAFVNLLQTNFKEGDFFAKTPNRLNDVYGRMDVGSVFKVGLGDIDLALEELIKDEEALKLANRYIEAFQSFDGHLLDNLYNQAGSRNAKLIVAIIGFIVGYRILATEGLSDLDEVNFYAYGNTLCRVFSTILKNEIASHDRAVNQGVLILDNHSPDSTTVVYDTYVKWCNLSSSNNFETLQAIARSFEGEVTLALLEEKADRVKSAVVSQIATREVDQNNYLRRIYSIVRSRLTTQPEFTNKEVFDINKVMNNFEKLVNSNAGDEPLTFARELVLCSLNGDTDARLFLDVFDQCMSECPDQPVGEVLVIITARYIARWLSAQLTYEKVS